jgi:phage shock protein A
MGTEMPGMGKLKSFWERPEGKTGMIFAAGIILGGFFIMMRWGNAIVDAAENTMILGLYIVLACVIGYILMDGRFRASVFFLYKAIMRAFTGLVIQLDPISILKSYVEDMEKNHDKMNTQIQNLKGSIRTLQRTIASNNAAVQNQMQVAEQAKKQNMQSQVILQTRKAGRLQNSNRTYGDLLKKLEVLYRVLSKMYDNTGVLIEDTKDQVEQKEIEWKTIRQASSAMRSAMSLIGGDKDKRAMFEEAMQYMADDVGNKIGEMERFMELSESFMQGVDLQNGIFEEKGIQMLEAWEKDADSWLLGNEKSQIVADANDDSKVLDFDAPKSLPNVSHENQFSKLFDK